MAEFPVMVRLIDTLKETRFLFVLGEVQEYLYDPRSVATQMALQVGEMSYSDFNWSSDCTSHIRSQGTTQMCRQTIFACFALFLSTPFMAAQGTLARLPSSPTDVKATCSRVGEVLGRDVFAQTFLLKSNVGQMEIVPFSRWTAFFKIPTDSRSGRPREIEPTDIRLGDRLCVLLDPSESTAT